MGRLMSRTGLFLFLILIVMSGTGVAGTFKNSKYKVNLTYPETWTKVEIDKRRLLLRLIGPDLVSSVNVYAYTFKGDEDITMNRLTSHHMPAHFDGWVNLGEREAHAYEIKRANVKESRIALYSHDEMDEQMRVQKLIAAEYYFIKGKRGYVVNMVTRKRDWLNVKKTLKSIVSTFWVGAGSKPKIANQDFKTSDWDMRGKSGANVRSIESNFVVRDEPANTIYWESDSLKSNVDLRNVPGWIFAKGVIYFVLNKALYAVSAYDGSITWKVELGARVKQGLAHHSGRIYVVLDSNQPQLKAFAVADGQMVFERRLKGKEQSDPIVSGKRLFLVDGSDVNAFDSADGSLIWSKTLSPDHRYLPVAKGGYLVVSEKRNRLRLLNSATGEEHWSQFFATPLLNSPIIHKNMIIVSQIHRDTRTPSFKGIDLKNGHIVWDYKTSNVYGKEVSPPSVMGNVMVVVLSRQGTPEVVAFDTNTGGVVWILPWTRYDANPKLAPIVTNNGVFLVKDSRDPDKPGLMVSHVDGRTGKVTRSMSLPPLLNKSVIRIAAIQTYKHYLYILLGGSQGKIISIK
ncbi:PQQ-like beta-propeller repeat protein [bacterium]|jgi:outer membrane protein assembly factor BamB|nr:PQQ-like beta-propeller repeat protein [bacterium]